MYKVKYGKNHEFYKNLGIVGEGYTYEDALLDAIAQALINTYGN